MTQSILRLPAVKARTGLSRSTIYLRMSEGTFPAQRSLGARGVGWNESEITEWINARPMVSDDLMREETRALPYQKRKAIPLKSSPNK